MGEEGSEVLRERGSRGHSEEGCGCMAGWVWGRAKVPISG